MIGRTPIRAYDPKQRNTVFKDNPVYIRTGDRVRYCAIDEAEYLNIEKERDENYRYRITPYGLFSVKSYLNFLEDVKEEAERIKAKRPWAKEAK